MRKATLAAAAIAAVSAAQAGELRLGMTAPEPTPWAAAVKEMSAAVAAATGGGLTINTYFNNELGDGQTMARQVARGRLDMALLSNVEASLVLPEYGLLNSPYLFSGRAQIDCVLDNHLGGAFDVPFQQAGVVFLAPVEVGSMQVMAKTAVRVPGDIAGHKVRTSPAPTDTFYMSAVGAAAVPLSVPDTMPALKTNAVSGITTPIIMGVAGGYWSEAPEITLTDHSHQIGALLISRKSWNRLDDEQRIALLTAAKSMDALRQSVPAAEEALLAKAKAGGAKVHALSVGEKDQWRGFAASAQDRILSSIGGDASGIWTKLQAASASCAP